MGKSKRFIAKGEGEIFHLLHRSHTDKAHAGEENPSNFVLVPVNTNTKSSSSKRVSFGEFEDVVKGRGAERRDHINALGFKNDGYDYSQHLKEMGGGLFVGRDGAVRKLDNTEAVRSSLQLPEEALPSMGEELVRDLNAITISDECMDDDIREALFGDDDALEGFEELQDDFVAQVMQEPEVPDFDFDAHIAALIARSEQMALGGVSKVAPRGWGKPGKLSNGEEYVDEDDDDDIDMGEDEDGMSVSVSSSMRRLRLGRAVRRGAGEVLSAEEQALIDEEFEKTLQEYDEQEIGGLDDGYFEGDEDESVSDGRSLLSSSCVGGGGIDVAGSNPTFNRALDDFLQEVKDSRLMEGIVAPKKGSRRIDALESGEEDVEVDIKEEFVSQLKKQEEFQEVIHEIRDEHKDIETCQEYLRHTVEEEEWDCESILSTYSTLDNHPSLIKTPSLKSNRSGRSGVESTSSSQSIGGHSCKGKIRPQKEPPKPKVYTMPAPALKGSSQTAQIMLTGKLQLPQGFSSLRRENDRSHGINSTMDKIAALNSAQERGTVNSGMAAGAQEEKENDEEDELESYDEEREHTMGWEEFPSKTSAQKETAEEKKLRKQLVKEQNRLRRCTKKEYKMAFKHEYLSQVVSQAKAQDINSVRVFKYTV